MLKIAVDSETSEDIHSGKFFFPARRLVIRDTTHKEPVCCPNNPVDQLNCFQTSVPTALPPLLHIWLSRPAFQPQLRGETPIVPDAALHHACSL